MGDKTLPSPIPRPSLFYAFVSIVKRLVICLNNSMRIQRDVLGWRIEPSIDEEEKALEFLLDALQKKYCDLPPKAPKEWGQVSCCHRYTVLQPSGTGRVHISFLCQGNSGDWFDVIPCEGKQWDEKSTSKKALESQHGILKDIREWPAKLVPQEGNGTFLYEQIAHETPMIFK